MTVTLNARRLLLGGTALAAMAIATPAWAQTAAETQAQPTNEAIQQPTESRETQEVIVTATKRATRVQDVPFSINAQTEEDIQRANASSLEDVSRNVAGLAVQNLGPGQSQVSIRGVSAGQIVRDQPGVKEQVGVYLDESVASLSLFTPDFDLFDLNRVETLRGPQGTLFGSGSVGGTLRYITNQPRLGEVEAMLEGNVNTISGGSMGYSAKGMLNAPISDTLAARLVTYGEHIGGFIDAFGPGGGKNVNQGDRAGTRISLLFQPSAQLKITPRFVYQEVTAGGFNRQEVFNLYSNAFTNPARNYGEREQYLLQREKFEDKTRLMDLVASYDFGAAEVTSVTSQVKRDILVSRDASALTGSVSVDLGFPNAAVNIPSRLNDTTDLKQFTQELRLASTGEGPLSWVVGGFYSKVKRTYSQLLPTPGYDAYVDAAFGAGTSAAVSNGFGKDSPYNALLPYDIKQTALFGEGSYDFGQLKLTAGGRYYDFTEERSFTSGGLFSGGDKRSDSTKSNGFSPRIIATFEPSRNLSFNAQASKGFRLGGVNDPLNVPLCSAQDKAIFGGYQSYDDETLWNYEAGVKFSNGPVTVNAAGYYTDIKNLQVTLDAGSCSSRVVFNVPKAHTKGLEAELGFKLLPGLDLGLAASLVEAKFASTVVDGTGAVLGGIRDGNRLPSVPKLQLSATGTYETRVSADASLYATASYQHVGDRYTQPSDQENNPRTFVSNLPFNGASGAGATVLDLNLPAYDLVNASVGVNFDNGLDLVVYANNLFDENPLLSFDRERGGRARLGFNVGTPRTFGLTVRKAIGK